MRARTAKLVGVCSAALVSCSSVGPGAPDAPPAQGDRVEEAIRLETATGTLYGTAALPVGPAPFDLALILSGSGPTDRDGNSALLAGRNDSLRQLAHMLARRGVASVRFDKRGIGQSAAAGPDEAELRFETYVDDVLAWLEHLREDERFRSLSIVGHSEGSLVGMVAARRGGPEAFVSIAGVARPASALLREQLEGQLSPELQEENERILSSLERGELVAEVPEALSALYRPSVQPYLISWFVYDPARELAGLQSRILIVHGTTDVQVPVADAQTLQEANPSAELLLLEGMNHVLKTVPLDEQRQLASYTDPSLPVDSHLVEAIARFLR